MDPDQEIHKLTRGEGASILCRIEILQHGSKKLSCCCGEGASILCRIEMRLAVKDGYLVFGGEGASILCRIEIIIELRLTYYCLRW